MDGPRKQVKWSNNAEEISITQSPAELDESEIKDPFEGLEYVNSQLVAHGFCKSPGLDLDGLSNASSDRVVKCLLSMLSQRMDDMSRSEDLNTKLRTLTYDYQRISSMHQTAQDVASRAEREMNIHKTKMQAAIRAQQSAEHAHKQTSLELSRTRNLMQGIRATHQSELRKKEKELERISEKWTKLADTQAKLMGIPSGIRCANVSISTGQEVIGQGQGFLDIALEEAENSRKQLIGENIYLRKLVLTAANELVTASHRVKSLSTSTGGEPSYLTLSTLFPLHPHDFAETKISSLGSEFRTGLFKYLESSGEDPSTLRKTITQNKDGEASNLQKAIQSLNKELDLLKEINGSQAAEIRVLRNENAGERQKTEEFQARSDAHLEAEKIQLDRTRKQLEHQNEELEEMRDELERARAEIESERTRLEDERKVWKVEQMLSKPSPDPTPEKSEPIASSSSPRRPSKTSSKASRRSRLTSSRKAEDVIPPFETEVVPEPAHKLKRRPSVPLLASTFVLPPPTPHTSLPSQPALLDTLPPVNFSEEEELQSTTPPPPATTHEEPEEADSNPLGPPGTPEPVKRPFPMAKPLAQRMIHAYSPAKPSPLSRILMLGNSPNSPEAREALRREVSLGNISEEEAAIVLGSLPAELPVHAALEEAELGIEEDDGLQAKRIEANLFGRSAPAEKVLKRQAKSVSSGTHSRPKPVAAREKENPARPRVFTAKPASPARPTVASRARSTLGSRPAALHFKVAPTTIPSPRKGPRRAPRDPERLVG